MDILSTFDNVTELSKALDIKASLKCKCCVMSSLARREQCVDHFFQQLHTLKEWNHIHVYLSNFDLLALIAEDM